MKIFLDTANIEQIKYWTSIGIINGVTTNPTHLSKEGGDIDKLLKEICTTMAQVDGDVSIEVTETEPENVYAQAKKIAAFADNVTVKIPCHKDYYEIIKKLTQEQVPLNITLVFTALQGLFMCKLGVRYISPFIGRLDDIDTDGIQLVQDLRTMMDEYAFIKTEIIAASIRNVERFHDAMIAMADVATLPVNVLEKAVKHPLTDQGMKKFIDDWNKLGIKKFP